MCKKNNPRKIDLCMKEMINLLSNVLQPHIKILACCCGHGKYPMTIVMENKTLEFEEGSIFELFSMKTLGREKRFYKKDKQGNYFIPEIKKRGQKCIDS